MNRIGWPWDVDALLALRWPGSDRVRIELKDRFYAVIDAAMRLPEAERGRVVVWAAFDGGMTELGLEEVQLWGRKPDRPVPALAVQQVAHFALTNGT